MSHQSLLLLAAISVLNVILCVQGQANGDLRLVSSSGAVGGTFGRLEVYYDSKWGTVCDNSFGGQDAMVACRQLGFFSYWQILTLNSVPAALLTSKIWLAELSCIGTESRLIDCNHNGFGINSCAHSEDVGLVCNSASVPTPTPASVPAPTPATVVQVDLRLVGRDRHIDGIAGRVEVSLNSEWGTVCASNIRKVEADVMCRQLGFSESLYFGDVNDLGYTTVNSSVSILLSGLVCSGGENRLEECLTNRLPSSSCSHSNDLAVVCQGVSSSGSQSTLTGSLRLNTDGVSNPITYSGRLEVFVNGQWGTVCDDGFRSTEADTACRQLGYFGALDYGTVGYIDVKAASSRVPIWLDNLGCSSDSPSQRLVDCSPGRIGIHNCNHDEDIALVCLGVGSLRLVKPSGLTSIKQNSGRLEVYVRGTWGTVCDNSFGKDEAEAACLQLGYTAVTSYNPVDSSSFSTSLPIFLDRVNCPDNSNFLLGCDHLGIGNVACSHIEDIELTCSQSVAAIIIGVCVPVIFITIVTIICCCCCCCFNKKKKKTSTHTSMTPGTANIQPTTSAVVNTGASAATRPAYPVQQFVAAPQHQQFVAAPQHQPAVYLVPPQQGYPVVQGNPYASPQPQQPPLGYSTLQQQPPLGYSTLQQQSASPYSPGQQQSVYPPPEPVKSDLHTDAPPAYSVVATELTAYPPHNPSGYPQ